MELRLREERHSATKSAAFVLVQHNNTTSRQKKHFSEKHEKVFGSTIEFSFQWLE